ncbi:tetratricopeptide repeat protein [bacterium]|nr:tetratricopeptide repeat protein [bacterium]
MNTKLSQWAKSLAALAAVLTLGACAGLPSDPGSVRDIYAMRQMLEESTKKQDTMDSKLTYSLESVDKSIQNNSQIVQGGVEGLTKQLHDQQAQLDQIRNQMASMNVLLDQMARRAGMTGMPQAGAGTEIPTQQPAATDSEMPKAMTGGSPAVTAFNTAVGQYNAGQYDQAREGFRAALEQNPTADQKIEIQYWQAMNSLKAGDSKTALEQFDAICRATPSDPRAWNSIEKMAQIYRQSGDLANALKDYKMIVDTYPDYPNIQRVKQAVQEIEAARSAAPTH